MGSACSRRKPAGDTVEKPRTRDKQDFRETRNVNIQTEKSFNHTRSRYREGNYEHLSVEEGPLLEVCSGGPGKLVRDVRVQSQTSCVKESRALDGFDVIGEVGSKVGYLRTLPAREATAEGERIRRL